MTKLIFFLSLVLSLGNISERDGDYYREYYATGQTKAKGWLSDGQKMGYWYFYHPNGQISEKGNYVNGNRSDYWYFYDEYGTLREQGSYRKGEKADWWLFYNEKGSIYHKCQLYNGEKNGYCLRYENNDIVKAEKYKSGKKLREWTSYSSFRKENKLSDLR